MTENKTSKVNLYSPKGINLGTYSLPKDFDTEVNLELLAQAIRVYEERVHTGLAKTKTRAEVNRTKKKWYKQKGTGGARHGARSAPIFVGGGVAHGPRPVKRELVLPKKMARKALKVAFSIKVKDRKVALVDGLSNLSRTKEADGLIKKLTKNEAWGVGRLTFVLAEENQRAAKALRNLENVEIVPYKSLNAYRVFFGGMLVLDKEIFDKKGKRQKAKGK